MVYNRRNRNDIFIVHFVRVSRAWRCATNPVSLQYFTKNISNLPLKSKRHIQHLLAQRD